jgi:hypothetical protein
MFMWCASNYFRNHSGSRRQTKDASIFVPVVGKFSAPGFIYPLSASSDPHNQAESGDLLIARWPPWKEDAKRCGVGRRLDYPNSDLHCSANPALRPDPQQSFVSIIFTCLSLNSIYPLVFRPQCFDRRPSHFCWPPLCKMHSPTVPRFCAIKLPVLVWSISMAP